MKASSHRGARIVFHERGRFKIREKVQGFPRVSLVRARFFLPGEAIWDQWKQISKAIGSSAQNYDRDSTSTEILLVSEALIDGDQQLEPRCGRGLDQLTILEAGHARMVSSPAIVFGEGETQSLIDTFVHENAHLRPRKQQVFRLFQNLQREFARNRGKSSEEVF